MRAADRDNLGIVLDSFQVVIGGGARFFALWLRQRGEARRRSQEAAVEEGLKGARQDGAPFLQAGQLLRVSRQGSQERGDGGERPGGRLGLACALVTRIVVCRACRARVAIAVRNSGGW